MQAALLRLRQGLSHDLRVDPGNLDIHLQGGNALARPGDLKIHVAVVIFGAGNIAENGVLVSFHHQAHRHSGDRRL